MNQPNCGINEKFVIVNQTLKKYIGDEKEVVIPKEITKISPNAFEKAKKIESLVLHNNVEYIGDMAFYGCKTLKKVTVSQENVGEAIPERVMYNRISEFAFAGCSKLKRVEIPRKIYSIGECAFCKCVKLEEIVFPNDLCSIGKYSFEDCHSLKAVILSKGLRTLKAKAFRGCSALKSVTFYENLKTAEILVFENCISLEEFNYPTQNFHREYDFWEKMLGEDLIYKKGMFLFPKNSTVIKRLMRHRQKSFKIFLNMDNNEYVEKFVSLWSRPTIELLDSFIETAIEEGKSEATSFLIEYKLNTFTEEKMARIQKNQISRALGERKITVAQWKEMYNFRKENKKIKILSFHGEENIVDVPDSIGKSRVVSIGKKAFFENEQIVSVTLPEGLTSIGNEAFSSCPSLRTVSVPESISEIGDDVFYQCPTLKYNVYQNGLYLGNDSNPYVVLVKAKSKDIKECVVSEKTKIICSGAFSGCTQLEKINIPQSVCEIGSIAFMGCKSLKSVFIHKDVRKIRYSAFLKCETLTIYGQKGTSAEISAFVQQIDFKEK